MEQTTLPFRLSGTFTHARLVNNRGLITSWLIPLGVGRDYCPFNLMSIDLVSTVWWALCSIRRKSMSQQTACARASSSHAQTNEEIRTVQNEGRPVFCWSKRETETTHCRCGIQHKSLNLVALKQAWKVKCAGRERHLKQTETGKSKERDGWGWGQHQEAEKLARSNPTLDRFTTAPYTTHCSQMLQKLLLDFNQNTFIRQVIILYWKNETQDMELAKVRQWPRDELRSF